MRIIICVILAIIFLGCILFLIEIKKAQLVDNKEPFLWGDYDPDKDPNAPHYLDGY